jgi:formylglycine-generating enzyme required for sulfatase activity
MIGMIAVPGGQFTMGNPVGYGADYPSHPQIVTAFFLDESEVTAAAYADCVTNGPCTAAETSSPYCTARGGKDNHPINCVSWYQATTYCEWKGKRLPTEIEFEYVLRGTSTNVYAWGNVTPGNQLCWNRQLIGTCPVGSSGKTLFGYPDPKGAWDLAGNVAEWTKTSLCKYPLTISGGIDCQPSIITLRVGHWEIPAGREGELTNLYRAILAPHLQTNPDIGFRCAL